MTDLSPSEVAALFDLDERRVRKDVEYGVFDPISSPPRLDLAKVVYLLTLAELAFELGVEDRKKIYVLIAQGLRAKRRQDISLSAHVVIKLDHLARDTENRLKAFRTWKNELVSHVDILGGEPVFPKSRLAVRHIGEMARRGAPVEEILEDYPSLQKRDIEFAKRYVVAYPRVGRPRAREATAR